MSFLLYVGVNPWQLAAIMAVATTFLSGLASVEVRQHRIKPWWALMAVMFADSVMLLVIPALSPALVTTISGVGMVTIIWLAAGEDVPKAIKISAAIISLAVITIAIDLHFSGDTLPSVPTKSQQAAFWVIMAILASFTAMSTLLIKGKDTHPLVKTAVIIGKGLTSATNTALVYTIMKGGKAELIPVLICGAMFDIYVLEKSLSVNLISHHMPIDFCVYQFAVWLSAPAVADMTYHGGAGAAVGTVFAVIGATVILINSKRKE